MSIGGRPTKYKKEYCDKIIVLMAEGISISEVSRIFQVNESTIYEWAKHYPLFSNALKKARTYSKAWWSNKGRSNLENKEFNYQGWYMQMRNRFSYHNKQFEQQKNKEIGKKLNGDTPLEKLQNLNQAVADGIVPLAIAERQAKLLALEIEAVRAIAVDKFYDLQKEQKK